MTNEFSFMYQGTRSDGSGTHYGTVTNLQKMNRQIGRMKKPLTGCLREIEGSSKEELWKNVQDYIRNYYGGWNSTVIINGVTHKILGHRR